MDPDNVKEWLEFAILIVVMGVSVIILTPFINAISTPIIADYSDKTAVDATGSIMTEDTVRTGADLFLAIANSDLNLPYPRSIKINNSPILDLDNKFLTNLSANLALVYTDAGSYKLKSMLEYKIQSVEFVKDDVNGDYWHYTLVP